MSGEEVQKIIEQIATLGKETGGEAGRIFRAEVWPLLVRQKIIIGWWDSGIVLILLIASLLGWRWALRTARAMGQESFDFDKNGWIQFVFAGLVVSGAVALGFAYEAVSYLLCPECAALRDLAEKVLRP